jgi:hypothetical protein
VLTFLECVVTHFLFLSVLSLTLFECVITLVTNSLGSSFLCKGSSSTCVKLFLVFRLNLNLLEVESPGDVGISRISLHLMFLFDFFSFLIFLWLLYYCENWIILNYIPLPLYLNTKPQIGLYISILDSLHSYTILTFNTTILGLSILSKYVPS